MGLVELTKQIGAVCAVLLTEQEGKIYQPRLTLGLTEASIERFHFASEDAIARDFFSKKRTLVINEEIQKVGQLKNKLSDEDLKYVRRSIFFPAQLKEQDAVLFLGFAGDRPIQINRLLSQMNVSLTG